MIAAWLLMLQATASSPTALEPSGTGRVAATPTLGTLPRQSLPASGCAAFLWKVGGEQRQMVAVASATTGVLRLSLDGRTLDLSRIGPAGGGSYGLEGESAYRAEGTGARIALDVTARADLTGGAVVPSGTLTVERVGGDAVATPVAGLIGCAPQPGTQQPGAPRP